MFIMPSFKKALIVEQFQGNYLKFNLVLFGIFLRGAAQRYIFIKIDVSKGKD